VLRAIGKLLAELKSDSPILGRVAQMLTHARNCVTVALPRKRWCFKAPNVAVKPRPSAGLRHALCFMGRMGRAVRPSIRLRSDFEHPAHPCRFKAARVDLSVSRRSMT
jgi:hypothetical protein